MVRRVVFNADARQKLLSGISILANAVKVTLGPKGRNVIIDKNFITPHITKDGVTVAQDIILEERVPNIGCSMIKTIARKTAEEAGDGTTTATVLAHSIFSLGMKALDEYNPIDIKRGMDKAVKSVTDYIKKVSTKVTNLKEVAVIATNGDIEMGNLIAEIMGKIGKEGTVTVENSNSHKTYYEIVEGHKYDSGYISPYFVTNNDKQSVEFDNSMVLVTDEKINSYDVIEGFVQLCHSKGAPLLIICEEMSGQALYLLLANKANKGLQVCVTSAPGYGGQRKALLEDIAGSTGATLLGNSYGRPFHMYNGDKLKASVLGGAKRIVVNREGTIIIGGNASKDKIQNMISTIEQHRDLEPDKAVKELFTSRIARLKGGVAVLKVGGYSEVEVNEKKDRIDDAIRAVQSSMEEGIVAGGGTTYINAIGSINIKDAINVSEEKGMEIIKEALETPFNRIAINAGHDPKEIKKQITTTIGYDFRDDEICDLLKKGIVDPAKVLRVALENAVSVSGLLLTTECIVYNKLTDIDVAMLAKGPQMNKHK